MTKKDITIGTQIETISGTATVIEIKENGMVKIKHNMPAGGCEEWMRPTWIKKAN
jgi:hypothetical protein